MPRERDASETRLRKTGRSSTRAVSGLPNSAHASSKRAIMIKVSNHAASVIANGSMILGR